jgi:hypothetical protein
VSKSRLYAQERRCFREIFMAVAVMSVCSVVIVDIETYLNNYKSIRLAA